MTARRADARAVRADATAAGPTNTTPLTRRRRTARRQRADTMAAILVATEDLLRERRWASLSVDDVAQRAGLARTAFYRFYPDLGAVLQALLQNLVGDIARRGAAFWRAPAPGGAGLSAQATADPGADGTEDGTAEAAAALRAAAVGTVTVFRLHHHLIRAFVEASATDDDLDAAYRRAVGFFTEAAARRIRADQRAGLVDPTLDADRIGEALVWMSERFLSMAYVDAPSRPPADDQMVATLVTIWWRTLYARPG